jgi:hypothetical protein
MNTCFLKASILPFCEMVEKIFKSHEVFVYIILFGSTLLPIALLCIFKKVMAFFTTFTAAEKAPDMQVTVCFATVFISTASGKRGSPVSVAPTLKTHLQ